MPTKTKRQLFVEIYRWLVISIGGLIAVDSFYHLFVGKIEWRFWFLAAFTALVASQISIKIPRFNGNITVSDTFIFLALLIWGAPGAILTSVADSVASTSKVSRKVRTYLFNAAAQAIATWTTAQMLLLFFGAPAGLAKQIPLSSFVMALCLMALTQYAVNSTIVAVMQALKLAQSVWRAWTRYYLWTSLTFFVGAAAAGLVAYYAGEISLLSVATVAPIIGLVYFTYQTYLRNLDALQESEARFRSSFDYATVGMALVSPNGRWLQVNQSLSELLGRDERDLLESNYQSIIHETDLPPLEAKIEGLLAGEFPACQMEVRLIRRDEKEVWALLSASTAGYAQNSVKHLIFQTQDVTLRKNAEDKLRHDASHDALTGLPNRASYTRKLEQALERSKETGKLIAVLFLDLDGFKLVNDSLGHVVGDDLLKGTAARLLECLRGRDTVARLGGDEFTILLEDLPDISQAVRVAERIKQRLSEPFELAGQEIFIGTSIGIATSEIAYADTSEILRDADAAMYQAKARGKGCYVVFDQEMYANASRLLRLANDLRRAAERGELMVHYQPVQCLDTDEICSFEALARWNHPVFGVLMPSEFVPLAEENGLINQIDSWILAESCRQMREWQKSGLVNPEITISVNVSTRQFAQNGLVENVRRILRETGLNAACLQLEITESAMAKNLKNTARVLKELSRLGVSIALDDFGTGYSSLSYLHEFPISTLKIDRSFVTRMSEESDGAEIVRAIIALARNMQMRVVAEGIETLEQLEQLRQMNCDFGQGFLFSQPVPASEVANCINSSNLKSIAHRESIRRGNLRLVSNG
ncbi:MAG TPA: EAL domain-containing protein [Pyrinomonadaceae bacterium]|jgi:diguanylate cyclase (GGDEF)-like protein/PAS domain S-box-containing protein